MVAEAEETVAAVVNGSGGEPTAGLRPAAHVLRFVHLLRPQPERAERPEFSSVRVAATAFVSARVLQCERPDRDTLIAGWPLAGAGV